MRPPVHDKMCLSLIVVAVIVIVVVFVIVAAAVVVDDDVFVEYTGANESIK